MQELTRDQIAELVAADLPAGSVVNLGIGMPTLVTKHLTADRYVFLHSENGILGMVEPDPGVPPDPDLINASKQFVALIPGASIFDHASAFAMMRGGHIDISVLGAYEVAANGDLANWSVGQDDLLPAVGGAMDLAVGARTVWVMMEALTREGSSRLLDACTLPLTGRSVVSRVYTNIGVFAVQDNAFTPLALVDGLEITELGQYVSGPVNLAGDVSLIRCSHTENGGDDPARIGSHTTQAESQ
jgi:3-oxoadipate CoA-transferase beta subunit